MPFSEREVPEVQTEDALLADHERDLTRELVHGQRLIALSYFQGDDEAPRSLVLDFVPQIGTRTGLFDFVNLNYFLRKELLEVVLISNCDKSLGHVWQDVERALLGDAEDAL